MFESHTPKADIAFIAMALFDKFKKAFKKEGKAKEKPRIDNSEKKTVGKEIKKRMETKETVDKLKSRKRAKIGGMLAWRSLKSPHITEKATALSSQNQYVFKVEKKSNKTEIKKAIEEVYGVGVLNVNIINIPRKKRRLGRIEGFKPGYKKAIVKLKEGEKIEIMPH